MRKTARTWGFVLAFGIGACGDAPESEQREVAGTVVVIGQDGREERRTIWATPSEPTNDEKAHALQREPAGVLPAECVGAHITLWDRRYFEGQYICFFDSSGASTIHLAEYPRGDFFNWAAATRSWMAGPSSGWWYTPGYGPHSPWVPHAQQAVASSLIARASSLGVRAK